MISLTQVLIWIVIAAGIGFVGELLARRRAPDGILGAILLGLLAIFLIVGIFHFPTYRAWHHRRRHDSRRG